VSTMKQVSAPLRAMRLRRAGSALSGNGQKRRDGGEGIDQKEDRTERQHREAHQGRGPLSSLSATSAGLVQIRFEFVSAT
jgi:hypothetical protein